MNRKMIAVMSLVVLLFASVCFGEIPIRMSNLRTTRLLHDLLTDRIGTLDDQVTTLQAASTSGVYENLGTGDVFYVDSATGSDGDTGVTWALAKATIDAAIGLCANANHDVIYVASGHGETLAAAITCDISDVTIIGIGSGVDMPEITFNTSTDEILVSAQGVTMYNLRFLATAADVTNCIEVAATGDYFTLIGCEFPEPAGATHEFAKGIQLTTAGNNVTIAYNTFINIAATPGVTAFIDGGAGVVANTTIVGNHINADVAGGIIFSDKADTNLLIMGNTIVQEDIDKLCIQLSSTATGIIANNLLCNLGGTAYLLDAGSCHLSGNMANVAIDSPDFPWPAPPAEGRYVGTGNVYYVDSGTPGAGDGESWGTAVATLDAGINLCTTLRGDTIYVAAGHTEDLGAGADGVNVDLANITIIGLGSGKSVPFFDYDTTTDEFVIAAAGDNCHIKNLRFHSNITAVVHAIEITGGAENFVIEDCLFDLESTGTDDFIDAIDIGAACHGGLIKNCRWYMGAGSDNDSAIHFVNADYLRIEGCEFYGDYVDAAIFNETTASIHITIKDNLVFQGTVGGNAGLNAKPCISLKDDTTGMIVNNTLACNVASPDLAIVAADCFLAGNTYTEDESTAGSFPVGTMAGSGIRWVHKDLASIATTQDLFAVTGGPIKVLDILTVVTSTLETTASTVSYNIDPTAPDTDTVWGSDGTPLDWTGAITGSVFIWDGVMATDLTKVANGASICPGTDVSHGLFIPIGSIELAASATMTGTVTVYMTYVPMSSKSMVVPQ